MGYCDDCCCRKRFLGSENEIVRSLPIDPVFARALAHILLEGQASFSPCIHIWLHCDRTTHRMVALDHILPEHVSQKNIQMNDSKTAAADEVRIVLVVWKRKYCER